MNTIQPATAQTPEVAINLDELTPRFTKLTGRSGHHPPIVQDFWFWQIWQWTFDPLAYLDRCAQQYGDCFVTQFGKLESVYVSHPEAIAEIFTQPELYDSGRAQQVLKYTLGNSSLTLDGEPHRRRRQLLMPPFHGERMKSYGDIIRQITEQVAAQSWQVGQTITMLPLANDITLRVILKAVFGVAEGERFEQMRLRIQKLLSVGADPITYMATFFPALLRNRGPWRPLDVYTKLKQQVDEHLYAEISERRANSDHSRTDILTLLMSAQDEDGNHLTDLELRDELVTMLLAGHDSSAATISWAMYFIHATPAVKAKLLDELTTVDPTDALATVRLPYLNAVCSEALRLRSAGPTVAVRVTKQPVMLMGYELPADTVVLPCQYLTHHREDIYPNARQFRPERFLERQYSPYEYYPFGGSDRRCIGAAFASFEMKLVLATLLRHYQLELAESPPIKAVRRGVNISPQGGVKLRVVNRTRF
jgi:unspecific monooxygenase